MALVKCRECDHEISDKAESCPHCGCPKQSATQGHTPPPPPRSEQRHYYYQQSSGFSVDDVLSGGNNQYYHSGMSKEEIIKQFMFSNRNKFPQERLPEIDEILHTLDEQQLRTLTMQKFKSPEMMLIISVLVGYLGVDRFLINDTVNGALKLILTVCCGVGLVWWIVDLFLIQNLTRQFNFNQFLQSLRIFNISVDGY